MGKRRKSKYMSANLRNRVDVYTPQLVENDFGIEEQKYAFYKKVFADIRTVRRKERQGEAETEYVITSHEIMIRTKSLPDLDETYRFKYKDIVLQAKYINYDFRGEGYTLITCERVVK